MLTPVRSRIPWLLLSSLIVPACTDSTAPAPVAVKVAFTVQPSNATAGVAIDPLVAVAIEDASGNTVTGANNVVTLSLLANASGGTLTGPLTATAVDGIATFPGLRILRAGTGYALKAEATRLSAATSTPFAILVGPATQLLFTAQPSNVMGGATITPPVAVVAQDSVGNRATAFAELVTVALGINPVAGALLGTTVVRAVNGLATFRDLSIAQVSSGYTLTASAGTLTVATSTTFGVAKPTATLSIPAATSGSSFDPDGYTACIDPASDGHGGTACEYGGPLAVAVNGTGTVTVDTGAHSVLLTGVAVNCAVAGDNPRTVHAGRGETASVPFAVACAAVTLHVTATTTGASFDPDGYYVCIDEDTDPWDYGCGAYSGAIGVNGNVSYEVTSGTHVVQLVDVALNCTVSGDNPRTVTVSTSVDVSFAVSCVTTGSLRVTTATTGTEPDLDGYVVCIDGGGNPCARSAPAGLNDLVTVDAVIAGARTVSLVNVAENCQVGGTVPRIVTVPPNGIAEVTFDVGCVTAERIAYAANGEIAVIRTDGVAFQAITPGVAPAWSPDGASIAYECDQDICTIHPDGSGVARITIDNAGNHHPTWSPDGARIAFAKTSGATQDLYVTALGSASVRLTNGVGFQGSPAWSPDGARIAFDCRVEADNDDICVVNADGTGFARLTTDPARDYGAAWKPDGSTLAFTTSRFGVDEVVLLSPTGGAVTRPGAGLIGSAPAWSPDGTRLAFVVFESCDDWCVGYDAILAARSDGTDIRYVTAGDQPAWKPHP